MLLSVVERCYQPMITSLPHSPRHFLLPLILSLLIPPIPPIPLTPLPPTTQHYHPLFHPSRPFHAFQANFMHILFHFVGGVFLSMLIHQNWGYQALWPIVVSCSFPTAMLEVGLWVRTRVLKSAPY